MQALILVVLGWGLVGPGAVQTDALSDTIRAQGTWGQVRMDTRYRYELVDAVGKKTARASTLRIRLGYGTPALAGFRAYVEVEGLQVVGADRYNSLRNGRTQYATVADPEKAELNQLWLDANLVPWTRIRIGRQRLTYDNHRFLGNVGWRQLEQTYDAVSIKSRPLPHLVIDGAYLWRVQTVLSLRQRLAAPLLHLTYTGWRVARVIAYGYWIGYEELRNAAQSVQTFGIRMEGSQRLTEQVTLRYTGEYAYQMDYRDHPYDFAVQYVHGLVGVTMRRNGWTLSVSGALELFTSDKGIAFSTPLATLHAFQGWADRFLYTPPQGLRDLYISASVQWGRVRASGVYHDFASEEGKVAYGRELDLVVSYGLTPNLSLLAKYAAYDARAWSVDVQKYWLMLNFNF